MATSTLLLATLVSPALAHPVLVRSVPARNDTLRSLPASFHLEFNKVLLARLTTVELRMPNGGSVMLRADSGATRAELLLTGFGALASGDYQLAWQVAGDDGHPVKGSLRFVVELPVVVVDSPPGAAGTSHHPADLFPTAPSLEDDTSFSVQSPGYVVTRWITYLALLTLVGMLGFRYLVAARLPDAPWLADAVTRAAAIGFWAALVLLAAAFLRLWAQAASTAMQGESIDRPLLEAIVFYSPWGKGWMLQVAGAVVAAIALGVARLRPVMWRVAAVGVLLAVTAMPMSGHAAAVEQLGVLPMLADGLHILGAGAWLGTLLMVMAAAIPATRSAPEGERIDTVAALVGAFSPVALGAAGVLVITGVFAAWLHIGSIGALFDGGYARVLLIKLGVLSIVVATGAYNWRVVKPALGTAHGVSRLSRSAWIELAVATIVIAITAVLVATPPGMTPH